MIDEEEKCMAGIIKAIETHMRDRARLAKELEVALQDPDEESTNINHAEGQ